MAVGPRPLAYAPARRGLTLIVATLLVIVLAAASAEALDIGLEPYRQAARASEVGVVTGRVYEESRKPGGPVKPLTGAAVALLPRSEALLASLQRFKEDARGSSKAFTAAAPAMRRAQETLERELVQAGVPDLAPRAGVGTDGTFRITDVPAGAWLVLVWQSTTQEVSAPKTSGREGNLYQLPGRVTGFQAVTVWLREITVTSGRTVSLELNDRNEWFRGVIEDKRRDTGR